MPVHVALLYSIVLGPGRRVVMAELRQLAGELGFTGARTLLASGNLIFEANEADPRAIEARLEPAFAERFGRQIDIIVREAARWPRLLKGNPFPEAAARQPAQLAARVMRQPVAEGVAARLNRYRSGGERLAVVDGDLWVHFPDGQGTSRLAAAITPARAGIGTFRNFNTLSRIGGLLSSGA